MLQTWFICCTHDHARIQIHPIKELFSRILWYQLLIKTTNSFSSLCCYYYYHNYYTLYFVIDVLVWNSMIIIKNLKMYWFYWKFPLINIISGMIFNKNFFFFFWKKKVSVEKEIREVTTCTFFWKKNMTIKLGQRDHCLFLCGRRSKAKMNDLSIFNISDIPLKSHLGSFRDLSPSKLHIRSSST